MFGIGPPELLIVFLIILILFGAKRLPELARSLGRSINEFKSATQNIKDDLDYNRDDDSVTHQKKRNSDRLNHNYSDDQEKKSGKSSEKVV
ncbi:MAG: twin-arginine translocase TatA/TatE family subunit [Calditrichia bacterium]